MTPNGVVVLAEHRRGELADITLELLACGRIIANATASPLRCVILTDVPESFLALPLGADKVVIVKDEALGGFSPETHVKVLSHLLRDMSPRLILAGNTLSGSDLAGPLSLALDASLVSGCVAVEPRNGSIVATSQICGGKLRAVSEFPPGTGMALLMPGSYPKEAGMADRVPEIEIRVPPEPLAGLRTRFQGYEEPEAADVDVTKAEILVGAGRGVQEKANLAMLEELAVVLGGAVCASRPIVDQGWLPRTRQVGRSGATVKPRLYLALGISGAPEHVEGMKDSELIVAVNTDPTAPIFEVAHYGATVDLLEAVPILLKKLKALRGG